MLGSLGEYSHTSVPKSVFENCISAAPINLQSMFIKKWTIRNFSASYCRVSFISIYEKPLFHTIKDALSRRYKILTLIKKWNANGKIFLQEGDPNQNSKKVKVTFRSIDTNICPFPLKKLDMNTIEAIFNIANKSFMLMPWVKHYFWRFWAVFIACKRVKTINTTTKQKQDNRAYVKKNGNDC